MTAMTRVNSPQQTFNAGRHFGDVFDALLQYRVLQSSSPEPLGEILRSLKEGLERKLEPTKPLMLRLAEHPNYSRHIIGCDDGWMGLICRWQRGAVTSIHGHPAFTFYYVIDGSFSMDLFHKTDTRSLALSETRKLQPGDDIWECGAENRYDNLIHRVRAHTDGFTLQLFSQDPTCGEVFDEHAVDRLPAVAPVVPHPLMR